MPDLRPLISSGGIEFPAKSRRLSGYIRLYAIRPNEISYFAAKLDVICYTDRKPRPGKDNPLTHYAAEFLIEFIRDLAIRWYTYVILRIYVSISWYSYITSYINQIHANKYIR